MLDFYVKTRIRFSLQDKRLFEITKVEITRVDCTRNDMFLSFTVCSLKITYLLVDGKVGITELDRAFANKLSELGIKFCVCKILSTLNF